MTDTIINLLTGAFIAFFGAFMGFFLLEIREQSKEKKKIKILRHMVEDEIFSLYYPLRRLTVVDYIKNKFSFETETLTETNTELKNYINDTKYMDLFFTEHLKIICSNLDGLLSYAKIQSLTIADIENISEFANILLNNRDDFLVDYCKTGTKKEREEIKKKQLFLNKWEDKPVNVIIKNFRK